MREGPVSSVLPAARTRENGLKLGQRKFRSNIIKKIFRIQEVRTFREEAESLSLAVFKRLALDDVI